MVHCQSITSPILSRLGETPVPGSPVNTDRVERTMRFGIRSLTSAPLHLAVALALALAAALGMGGVSNFYNSDLHPDHAAVCRICASTSPQGVAARDAYLVRSGSIEAPAQGD
jgi:hypothetical protein